MNSFMHQGNRINLVAKITEDLFLTFLIHIKKYQSHTNNMFLYMSAALSPGISATEIS
jgi:hypothetical protein